MRAAAVLGLVACVGACAGVPTSRARETADPAPESRLARSVQRMPRSAERDIESVGRYLRASEPDLERRLKAIHDFVADRVAYDFDAWYTDTVPPEDADAEQVLARRLAVCAGYAALLAAIGRVTGDDVRVVDGEAIFPDGVRKPHAWNEAWIDDRWAPIDVTWDAGSVDGGGFHKRYRTDYFLVSNGAFSRDHFAIRSTCPPAVDLPVLVVQPDDPRAKGDFFGVVRDERGCPSEMFVVAPPR
jgi:hypothetical protein